MAMILPLAYMMTDPGNRGIHLGKESVIESNGSSVDLGVYKMKLVRK